MRYLLIVIVILGLWGYVSFPTGYDKRSENGLPYIPIDKVTPREQAEHIVRHYWDNIELEERDLELYPDSIARLLEQYFSFAVSQPESIYRSSLTLPLEHLSDHHLLQALSYYRYHLYRLESPYYDEQAYRHALKWALQPNRLHTQGRLLVDSLLRRSERSSIGRQAPDVVYMTRDGALRRLGQIHAPYTIVAFGSTQLLSPQALYDDAQLGQLGQAKRLRALYIYPAGNETLISAMPIDSLSPWIELGTDVHNEAWTKQYDIQADPEYYLLDKAQRIRYRGTSLTELGLYLKHLSNKSL